MSEKSIRFIETVLAVLYTNNGSHIIGHLRFLINVNYAIATKKTSKNGCNTGRSFA
jgi:hypothetical protein